MSTDPLESLFAQLCRFLVEEDFTKDDWKVVAAEFGVGDIAENTGRFPKAWYWGDDDQLTSAITFLRNVKEEDEKLARNIVRRAYTMTGGAEEDKLQRFPALQRLEEGNIEGLSTGTPHVPVHNDRFLDVQNVPGQFYPNLVEDINQCYRLGIYDATLVLTRKLLENLLIDILRQKFGTESIGLYYDPERSWFRRFSELIENFEAHLDDFQHISGGLDEDFISELESFRQSANAEAHSVETNVREDEIQEFRDQARHAVKVLFRIHENV